ncbi:hypothetical protein EJD97_005990, partial [Solanum chilense]
MEEEPCKKIIIVNDNQGIEILHLQAQYMTPPSTEPPDKRQQGCKINTTTLFDEYVVDISQDELDKNNHSLDDPDEDDETIEVLIKAFTPHNDQALEDEIQNVTQSQCLFPIGFQLDKL